jgi:hypothetical protein
LPAGQPDQIVAAVNNIESIATVSELVELLVVPPSRRRVVALAAGAKQR